MNIYEIDNAMFSLINEETGEIKDYEAFECREKKKSKIQRCGIKIS